MKRKLVSKPLHKFYYTLIEVCVYIYIYIYMKFFFGNLNLNLYFLHHTNTYTCKVTITQRIPENNNDTNFFFK